MITVECIHCNNFIGLFPYIPGVMQRIDCASCNKQQWLRHSNFDPTSYPDELVEIDEQKKKIKILTRIGEFK